MLVTAKIQGGENMKQQYVYVIAKDVGMKCKLILIKH